MLPTTSQKEESKGAIDILANKSFNTSCTSLGEERRGEERRGEERGREKDTHTHRYFKMT
jgi:hypothetical protein